jgi:hypothetical protein
MRKEEIEQDLSKIVKSLPITIKLVGVKKAERAIKRLARCCWFIKWICKPLEINISVNGLPVEADTNKEVR